MTKWRPDKNPRFRDQAFAGITGVLLSFQQFDIALELTSSPDETGEITGSYVSICNVKVWYSKGPYTCCFHIDLAYTHVQVDFGTPAGRESGKRWHVLKLSRMPYRYMNRHLKFLIPAPPKRAMHVCRPIDIKTAVNHCSPYAGTPASRIG